MSMRKICGLLVVLSVTFHICSAAENTIVLKGGTIYASAKDIPITNGIIVISDGKIRELGTTAQVSIPMNAETIECSGMFITAAYQNSHVHFTEDKWINASTQSSQNLQAQLEQMLTRYGFTTVVDTGSMLENTIAIRNRINANEIRGPRILTAGSPLYPENGIPFYLRDLPNEILSHLATPSNADEAASVATQRLENGADAIKLFTGSWVSRQKVLNMPDQVAAAAANVAHKNGKLVFAHASNIAGLEVALNAKVDVLAHALDDDRGWTVEHIKRMKINHMSMIPTLKLFSGPPYFKYILKEVGDFASAGGQILFGTDVGYMKDYDPTKEYEYMAQAGLNWKQILVSFTTAPAERFGEAQRRGKIAPGMDADLVVLKKDPAKDVKAFSDVRFTIRAGNLIFNSN